MIPKDIELADEKFDQPRGNDLLIGAELFYEILRSGSRTRPGNYPVLQETVLGWTFSGRTPVTVTTTKNEPQRTILLQDDNSPENSSNRYQEVDSVEQSSMSRQQAVNNSSTHMQHNNMMEYALLNCQRRNQSSMDFFAFLDDNSWISTNNS